MFYVVYDEDVEHTTYTHIISTGRLVEFWIECPRNIAAQERNRNLSLPHTLTLFTRYNTVFLSLPLPYLSVYRYCTHHPTPPRPPLHGPYYEALKSASKGRENTKKDLYNGNSLVSLLGIYYYILLLR